MFKHALLTTFLVVVASVLGVAAAQMNDSPQAFMTASNESNDVDFATIAPHQIIDTQKQEIEQFKKWRVEHM